MAAPANWAFSFLPRMFPKDSPVVIKASTCFCFSYLVNPSPSPQLLRYRACPAPWRPLPAASWDAASCFLMIRPELRRFQIQLPSHHIARKESNGALILLPPQIKVAASQDFMSLQPLQPKWPSEVVFCWLFIVMRNNIRITILTM